MFWMPDPLRALANVDPLAVVGGGETELAG
jgi:hypothetical protein